MSGRIRSVKPEWLEDELLMECSSDARVLSIALILLADDHGNGRAHYRTLRPRTLPMASEEQFAAAMSELVRIRYVSIYRVDDQSYYSLRNWAKHQKVNHPGRPRVPLPPRVSVDPLESARDSQEVLLPDQDQDQDQDQDHDPSAGEGAGEALDSTGFVDEAAAEMATRGDIPVSEIREAPPARPRLIEPEPGEGRHAQRALDAALREVGAYFVMADRDAQNLRTVVDAANAVRGDEPLHSVLERWARQFVDAYSYRTPKNWATWAQTRAANGGSTPRPPPDRREDTTPLAGTRPDAAAAEARARALAIAKAKAEAVEAPPDVAAMLGGIGRKL